jgi:hypothetical protein
MSKVSVLIDSFQSKIKMLEQSISQATSQIEQWTKNHAGLIGMLQATKEALSDAEKVVEVVAPDSSIAEGLNVAENIVNVVDNLESSEPAPADSEVPAAN